MIIKYKSVIIDGKDKSGQLEDLPDTKALHLVKLGYAEIPAGVPHVRPAVEDKILPKKRGKPWP